MKNHLLLFALLPLLSSAQTTVPRRDMFSLVGSYGVSTTLIQPKVTVVSGPYALRPETVNNPECYDDNGHLVNCNGNNRQLAIGVLYRLTNRAETGGWMLFANASMQEQTFTLNYPANRGFRIPVNCTPSIRRLLRSTGVSVAVGRFWDIQSGGGTQAFVRMGGMVAQNFQYLRGTYATRLPDPNPISYISGGSGTIINMYNQVPQYNVLFTPEIGLTTNDYPFELAMSVQIPVFQSTVFSELHTFAENNYITGKNRVDYTNATFNLTARLGFNLLAKTRRARTPRQRPAPEPPSVRPEPKRTTPAPTTTPVDPSPVHRTEPETGRFDKPLNKPITLLVNFEQSKSNLLPDSHADLDQLVQWMKANPIAEIRLEGHTDLIGDEQENLDLSRRRVVAVKDYLSARGIASYRVETAYFGESRPLNRNCPPPNYCPENRRVEMIIKKR